MESIAAVLQEPAQVMGLYPPHDYTVTGLLASRVQALPDKICLVFEGRTWTYSELARDVERTAWWLIENGVQAGDRVGVFSTNHPSTVMLFLALARIGGVMVPVNPEFGVSEASYVLNNAKVRGVVCSPEAYDRTLQACASLDYAPWIVTNETGVQDARSMDQEVAAAPCQAAVLAPAPDSTCVFIYSSGTTGSPKGAMHGQRSYVITAESFVVRLYLQPEDRILCVLPLFHINALFYSLGGTLAAGATLVLARRFSAGGFWRTVSETRATTVNLIGAAATILAKRDRAEYVAGHAMSKAFVAPLDQRLIDVFCNDFNVPTLIECYGMTEIPGVLSNPFKGPRKLGSMGKVSPHLAPGLPQPRLRIVDESFTDLPDGQQGQLLVSTPTVMQGYYGDPQRSQAAFHEGWFITGDIVWRDADGFYWFVARQKDIIRCRGENISGVELDRIMASHPDVLEAAAIGVPSDLGEEDVLAVVVARPGSTLQADDIARWVGSQLAAIKIPKYVVFSEALPKTATHRVEKFKLKADRELLARATVTSAAS
ncbi:AMP-binding protein [Pollutimonas sp. H1-120]|uniref:class I adenylate-forming enzyme family protein n=1 Tax=Pollutimonas sp. H1-120 TaxID=3148824 RepID=UPI003B529A3A